MKLDDLWIGDFVIIIRSGREGRFEGENNGKARIRVDKKILLIPASGLKIAPVQKKINPILEEIYTKQKPSGYQQKLDFPSEIDLHMQKLQPSKMHDNPVAILEFQLRKLTEYIDKAVDLRIGKVKIIHGKGTGALRMETMNIIESYPEKLTIYPVNNDGGVLVYFKY